MFNCKDGKKKANLIAVPPSLPGIQCVMKKLSKLSGPGPMTKPITSPVNWVNNLIIQEWAFPDTLLVVIAYFCEEKII